ncbi:MAG: YopX family protein [Patescibacteria group bacterium]|nr:YopX family protein [Patescibacteria group bacterium]
MKQVDLKFRQRINEKGDYHYWGFVNGTWIEPNNEWGYLFDSEQWTGLYDKTKKEIYVHDVIEYWKGHTSFVVFEGGGFVTKGDIYEIEGCGGSLWQNRKHIEEECKVIGSITDILYLKTKKKRSKTLSKSKKRKTT